MHGISPIDPNEPTWPGYTAAPSPSPSPPPSLSPPPGAGRLVSSGTWSAPRPAPRVLLGLSQIVAIAVGIVEAALLLRIALLLLAANPTAGFSSWVYGLTTPLVAPFAGVFPNLSLAGSVLDAPAILALIVYAMAGRILESLLHLLARL